MAKAERKSQINSHSARLRYKQIKLSRVPSAIDGTSYPMAVVKLQSPKLCLQD